MTDQDFKYDKPSDNSADTWATFALLSAVVAGLGAIILHGFL